MVNGTTYGYVRVSTAGQNVGRQVEKMEGLGISELFVDHASGKDMDRPEWARLMSVIGEGDAIVVDSLDRLGRNYDDVTREWRRLTREVGVSIRCLDLDFMDSEMFSRMDSIGACIEDMLLSLLAYVAQAERDKNRQRQAEGIAIAKAAGKYAGRKPAEIPPEALSPVVDLERRGEITATEAAARLGVSRRTYCRRRDALTA